MALSKLDSCICNLVEMIGPAKQDLSALLTGMIAILTAVKTKAQLLSYQNIEDMLYKAALEAELAVLNKTIEPVEAPFRMVLGYTKALSDCDPTNTLATILKAARDSVLTPVYEYEYEVEQLIASIDDNRKQIDTFDRWISVLQDVQDAIEECGAQ